MKSLQPSDNPGPSISSSKVIEPTQGAFERELKRAQKSTSNRLLSLDFLRGFIMVLLALESTGLYGHLIEATEGSAVNGFLIQFEHHPWNGLRFWDLIQPGFMFIAGTALAYSLYSQQLNGVPWSTSFRKTLRRSGWLFFWGVLDYAVKRDGLAFELWDVLTQLAFTTLVAFLVFNWSFKAQVSACVALLIITELLYRFTNIPGFNQPFTDQQNFGNWMDLQLMNKINRGGWVAINCIPTAVHTVAGAMVGKFFLGLYQKRRSRSQNADGSMNKQPAQAGPVQMEPLQREIEQRQLEQSKLEQRQLEQSKLEQSKLEQRQPEERELDQRQPLPKQPMLMQPMQRLAPLLIAAGLCLLFGYGLDAAGITPIIKRIATTSFTLASLGWCLLALALCYWWIDMLNHKRYLSFFTIVGMNSIFIYLFFEIVGSRWFNGYVAAISNGLMSKIPTPELLMNVITSLLIFTLEWLLCLFLYRKKIFFKL